MQIIKLVLDIDNSQVNLRTFSQKPMESMLSHRFLGTHRDNNPAKKLVKTEVHR